MKQKNKITLSITGIITALLITIGISYAYFSANLTGGEETTTITVTGGTMNIVYNGGASINVANIIPGNNPVASKTFTVTGNNTTDIEMGYKISLIVETNTFSEEALKYKLLSTNTDNNGTVVPSIPSLTNIGAGSKTISLGVGEFTSPTGGNKVHTYNLELYFPNADYNQNIDQEKEISAYVRIENYSLLKLREMILAQEGGASAIEAKGNPNFANVAAPADSGLYASQDEYGTSYYYRGVRENLNNNLIFGGFQWKIIRINGDGSVRIMYNGTEEEFNQSGTMNTTGANTQISGIHAWNTPYYNDAKYVGYMYGGANGVASTQRNGTTSSAATYNETSSNAKAQLDAWYQTNISGKSFENKILDNIFCNDRRLQNEVGGGATGPGYGNPGTDTFYSAYHRLYTNKTPTLRCESQNDRFTVNDTIIGNGNLTYPVGLITADEASMAGLIFANNTVNYLYTAQMYWTISPTYINSYGYALMFFISASGFLHNWYIDAGVNIEFGLRPVLNLDSQTSITGDGSAINPYRVI